MKLNKKKFLKSLEVAVSVAKNRATMPILSFLRIEAMDGQMTIHATDLDSHVQSRCECEGSLPAVCVPAQLLHGLAKSAGDDITLTMEKERLRFVSNGSAMLSTLKADEMPPFPDFKAAAIGLPTTDLADGLEAVLWNTAVDDNRPLVSMVFVKTEPKAIACTTFTGKTMAYFKRGVICAETQFVIPAVSCKMVADVLRGKDATLQVSENQVVATCETMKVAVKQFNGPFWNVRQMLDMVEKERKNAGEIDIGPLTQALECSQMVAADASRFAKVYLIPAKGRTRVQCQSTSSESLKPTNGYLTWLPFALPQRINVDAAMVLKSLAQFDDRLNISTGGSMVIFEKGDLMVVNSSCIPGLEIEDDELKKELESANDDPPPMDEPKAINPDDYKDVPVNF